MMNRILIAFICLILLYGCSDKYYAYQPTISKEELPNTCKDLTTKITTNWKKHKKLPVYKSQESFIYDLVGSNRSCIIGLEKSKIESLFGKSSEITDRKHKYFLGEDCLNKNKNCRFLYFIFNKNDKVQDYGYEMIEIIDN